MLTIVNKWIPVVMACAALMFGYESICDKLSSLENELSSIRGLVNREHRVLEFSYKILWRNNTILPEDARKLSKHVLRASERHHRDPDLILAIMKVESDLGRFLISDAGAIGHAQVLPSWVKDPFVECDLRLLDCNLKAAMYILAHYQSQYAGDMNLALTAYNRGPSAVDFNRARNIDPQNGYAQKVINEYNKLKSASVDDGSL